MSTRGKKRNTSDLFLRERVLNIFNRAGEYQRAAGSTFTVTLPINTEGGAS